MINVFIGYDRREEVAYHVLSSSILRRSSRPVRICPVALQNLKGIFNRKPDAKQSTEFSFSRFLVPYLSNYEGWSVFLDCDMLMVDDISKLWELQDDRFAVMCVQHDHKPTTTVKFLGHVQTTYERKNWSSVMLINNARCKRLTPDFVETATGLDLHRFNWLEDSLIGSIPRRWNHLVDYDPFLSIEDISNLHFTEGGPYFSQYAKCSYSDLWRREFDVLMTTFADKLL